MVVCVPVGVAVGRWQQATAMTVPREIFTPKLSLLTDSQYLITPAYSPLEVTTINTPSLPAGMSFLKGAYLWGSILFSPTPIHKSYSLTLSTEVFEIR